MEETKTVDNMAFIRDMNINAKIEAKALTVGAAIGGGVAAVVGGFLTLGNSLFRGVVAGVAITSKNLGDKQVPIPSAKERRELAAQQAIPATQPVVQSPTVNIPATEAGV